MNYFFRVVMEKSLVPYNSSGKILATERLKSLGIGESTFSSSLGPRSHEEGFWEWQIRPWLNIPNLVPGEISLWKILWALTAMI